MSEWSTKTFQQLIDDGTLMIGDGYRAKVRELGGDGFVFLRAGRISDDGVFSFEGV